MTLVYPYPQKGIVEALPNQSNGCRGDMPHHITPSGDIRWYIGLLPYTLHHNYSTCQHTPSGLHEQILPPKKLPHTYEVPLRILRTLRTVRRYIQYAWCALRPPPLAVHTMNRSTFTPAEATGNISLPGVSNGVKRKISFFHDVARQRVTRLPSGYHPRETPPEVSENPAHNYVQPL